MMLSFHILMRFLFFFVHFLFFVLTQVFFAFIRYFFVSFSFFFFFDTNIFIIMFVVDVRDACVQQRLCFPNFLFVSFRASLSFFEFFCTTVYFFFFFVVFVLLFFLFRSDLLSRRCSLSLDFCSEFFSTYRG